jgi:DNA polymerase-3 subunit chi
MSGEIQFYHLLTAPLQVALPRLLPKILAAGFVTLIKCKDAAQMQQLDEILWTFDPESFLPHGRADEPKAAQQPVLLSLSLERVNQANILIVADGETQLSPEQQQDFTKILDMFDGINPAETTAARERWKAYKSQQCQLTYYRQQQGGGWQKEG